MDLAVMSGVVLRGEHNEADGTSIGTGLQNTMDIVNQGCLTEDGGVTTQAALDAEIAVTVIGITFKDELLEIYNTIGNGGPEGNIGGFGDSNSFIGLHG